MYHPLKTKIKEMNSHEKSLIYGTDIIGDIQNVFHSPKGRGRQNYDKMWERCEPKTAVTPSKIII